MLQLVNKATEVESVDRLLRLRRGGLDVRGGGVGRDRSSQVLIGSLLAGFLLVETLSLRSLVNDLLFN